MYVQSISYSYTKNTEKHTKKKKNNTCCAKSRTTVNRLSSNLSNMLMTNEDVQIVSQLDQYQFNVFIAFFPFRTLFNISIFTSSFSHNKLFLFIFILFVLFFYQLCCFLSILLLYAHFIFFQFSSICLKKKMKYKFANLTCGSVKNCLSELINRKRIKRKLITLLNLIRML